MCEFLHWAFEAFHALISGCLFDTLICFSTWILCFNWTGLLLGPVLLLLYISVPLSRIPFFLFFKNLNLAFLFSSISSMIVLLAQVILSNFSPPDPALLILYFSYFTSVLSREKSYILNYLVTKLREPPNTYSEPSSEITHFTLWFGNTLLMNWIRLREVMTLKHN